MSDNKESGVLFPKGLKNCPFCKNGGDGEAGIYIINVEKGQEEKSQTFLPSSGSAQHGCYAQCDCCQAQGPWFPFGKVENAIKGWNARSYEQYVKIEED